MFWEKQKDPSKETPEGCAHALYGYFFASLRDKSGRIRVEELINAAASIAGERCIEAAGDFNPREHTMTPGSRVFSDKANKLLCGDRGDESIATVPPDSAFGMLRDKLVPGKYTLEDFPPIKSIFQYFAANIGKKEDWGKVPLSVPKDNQPYLLPLRVAYETRGKVDQLFEPLGRDAVMKFQAAVFALAEALKAVAGAIEKKIGLSLALETVNGMAKTAPMTDAAMAEAAKKSQTG